ncbi:hypothetical protein KQ725_15605, partial [Listeria monocytogenes]|nr:hypothetical protein [Listeria monocytogenes]
LVLHRGDRIAQLVVQRVERARFVAAERLPGSPRGDGGVGSSGGGKSAGGAGDRTSTSQKRDTGA